MSVVNGSDLFMWMDGELIAYSTSYTISMNMETRPRTNKGSGLFRSVLPGMFKMSASCDGLYVFGSSASDIANAFINRTPVTLQFGPKDPDTGLVDEDVEYFSGDYYVTNFELTASDAENATWSASFEFYDNFGAAVPEVPLEDPPEGYYVATDGDDDTGDGSYANPWATWQKGFEEIAERPGETLWIRGGTYQPMAFLFGDVFGDNYYTAVGIDNKDGSAGNMITVSAFPGEQPILDGVNVTEANGATPVRYGIFMRGCSYWHLKGLEITGFVQLEDELEVGPLLFQQYSHHNILELIRSHHNGGSGISFKYDCDDNLILNCDCWENYDHLSVPTPGNNSDGIEIADITATTYKNTIRGCRIWDNSDDGVDLMRNEGIVIIENSWAFLNGVTADYQATGFKLGLGTQDPATYQRECINCIAAYNKNAGFALNVSEAKMKMYNNIAVGNGYHGFFWYNGGTNGGASIFRNNIAYANTSYQFSWIYPAIYTFEYNSYDVNYMPAGPAVTDGDFVSVDIDELQAPRQADGSLPVVDCYHLTAGSDCIAAGVAIGGIVYDGDGVAYQDPPSIGPFEYV